MAVREFKLVNGKGQEYSLMDIKNFALLTKPTGLGMEYKKEYAQVGNTFIETFSKIAQKKIQATVVFSNYDNYRNMVNFIALSDSLKLYYKVPYQDGVRQFYKSVSVELLDKSEIDDDGFLRESIRITSLSLWCEETQAIYRVQNQDGEMRWDFKWDSKFASYDARTLKYINKGHTDAQVKIELGSNIQNPIISLYIEGELYQSISIHTLINNYEKLIYSSKENEFEITKILEDGSKEDLFTLDTIDFESDNVIRIPKNMNCEIRLNADNNIEHAIVTIYTYYISV